MNKSEEVKRLRSKLIEIEATERTYTLTRCWAKIFRDKADEWYKEALEQIEQKYDSNL